VNTGRIAVGVPWITVSTGVELEGAAENVVVFCPFVNARKEEANRNHEEAMAEVGELFEC
jgi:hypothetical protein